MYEDAFCVSPNAWGGVLNKDTIPNIKAKIVCGACNNQLQFASDAELLMLVDARWHMREFALLFVSRTESRCSAAWRMSPTSFATAWAWSIAAWRCVRNPPPFFLIPHAQTLAAHATRVNRFTATFPATQCSSSTLIAAILTPYPAQ
jgi:hypothetical protein